MNAAQEDGIRVEQIFVFVDLRRQSVVERPHRLLPAARRLQRQTADADVGGHQALAREHLEDPQDIFALTEAIEEHRHRPEVQRMRAQPHQMTADAGQFGQHHPHPLRVGRDLDLQQLFHRQGVGQIVSKVGQVVHAVGQRHYLLPVERLGLFLDAGMQEPDIRFGPADDLAIQFEENAQYAVGGRVLRSHVQDHAARRGRSGVALRFAGPRSAGFQIAHACPWVRLTPRGSYSF